jgi:transposase
MILMDNFQAHWANEVQECIKKRGGSIEFISYSSSKINPIETAWVWERLDGDTS